MVFVRGLKPKHRLAAAFGSYGWGGGAAAKIEEMIQEGGVEVAQPPVTCKYVPDAKELDACYAFGSAFAVKVKIGRRNG